MAEEQKPVEIVAQVGQEEAAPAAAPEQSPAAETTLAATDDKPAEDATPADATEEADAAKDDDKKEEVKPIEEGFLAYKAQGASFPKNLIASKTFFFVSAEAVESETLASYKKSEKSAETAHHNIAWAAETGNGLLFIGDKKFPTGIINLADATEPEIDGSNKFTITAKGNKHSFKATSAAERDGWVATLREKTVEGKELVATVTESETYKQTLESFKPVVKEPEAPKEEAAEEAAKTEESPKDDEPGRDELKAEEPKRRSASRKRASIFGFGKKAEKKEEPKSEETPATETPAAETDVVASEEAPAVEVVPDADDKAAEETQPESPKEKPAASKRNSFFGGVFSKKEKKVLDALKADTPEIPQDVEPATAETAPVIPPVEATTPLAVDVSSPANVPTETTESAVTGEAKKDVKEKRKSSLPFAFGKRDKSPAPVDGEEKTSKSAFSKLRATIKGKGAAKTEDKTEPLKEEAENHDEAAAGEEAPKDEAPKIEDPEAENKPENVPSATPAVTAAA